METVEQAEKVEWGNNVLPGDMAAAVAERFKSTDSPTIKLFVMGTPEAVDAALKGNKKAVLQCRNREGAEVEFSR